MFVQKKGRHIGRYIAVISPCSPPPVTFFAQCKQTLKNLISLLLIITVDASRIRENVITENFELQAAPSEDISLNPSNHVLNTALDQVLEEIVGGEYSPLALHRERQREDSKRERRECVCDECG